MFIDNFKQILPAIIGFLIGFSWLIHTILLTKYKLDLIKIVINWFTTKKVVIPTLATFILPFLFMYIYQELPILVDKWNLRNFVGILGAAVGAVIGFFVSEFRQWKTEGQQKNALRKMLNIEINQNLLAVAEFKNKADLRDTNIKDLIIKNSFPKFKYLVWESQVLQLPKSLTDEEINQINILYKELEGISIKYDFINKLVMKYKENNENKPMFSDDIMEIMLTRIVENNLTKIIQEEVIMEWNNLNIIITKVINNYETENIINIYL